MTENEQFVRTTRAESFRARSRRNRRLILRRRWSAGGIATLVSAALILGGTSFAAADVTETPAPIDSESAVSEPANVDTEAEVVADVTDADQSVGVQQGTPVESPAQPEPEVQADSTVAERSIAQTAPEEVATFSAETIEPLAVDGQAALRVKKLGQRISGGGVTALGGATFSAVPSQADTPPSINATSEYTCTTDVTGNCDIAVPTLTGGEGVNTKGYWIVENSAPAGWSRITSIGTGQHSAPKVNSPYMFFTGPVSGGVVEVTEDTTAFANPASGSTTKKTTQNGVVNARGNVALPESCGLSIALVLDTSQSINAQKMAQMKAAANSFVGDDGLGGTASSVSIYAFGTNAAQLANSTSLQSPGGQAAVGAVIDGLPADGSGFTNWDDAFRKVAFNAQNERYDIVMFLSDGDPTTYGTDGASNVDTNVSFRNVEEGALSANAVKDLVGPAGNRTKVVGVGIGLTSNSDLNLKAVSGPVLDEDYYLTDFPGLSEKLREIATKNCGGTLTVIKQTVDAEGDVIDAAADGWTFTGTTDGDWIAGPDGLTDELTLTTGSPSEGSVNFPLDFAGADSRTVSVTEQAQPGWTAVDVTCTDGVVLDGDAASFTVGVPAGEAVSCTVTNQSGGGGGGGDVGITKLAEIDGVPVTQPLESSDAFDYVLEVTNYGPGAATDVVVTDPIPERLTVTGITVPAGWTNDNAPAFVGADNTVSLSIPSLAPGATAEIIVSVVVNPVPVPEIPNLEAGDPVPVPVLPESTLVNEACVAAAVDDDDTNNCDAVTVETKDIAAIVYTRCVNDAPLLGFMLVKTPNLQELPVTFNWVPLEGDASTVPASVDAEYPGGSDSYSAEFEWPGSAFTPSGISTDYPGWRALQAADYAPGGGYYVPGTTTVMSAAEEAEFVFNGLILDPSELDYAWRLQTQVTLSVNPEMVVDVAYPAATPDCFVARHTEVQVEKTASVERTDPGRSFTYDLAVANVSNDAAAEGVVVTDTIPADLKITNVSWNGKGTDDVFPNWTTCAVTGQSGSGYGGTLTCELFGPLQPLGSDNGGSSEAPTITLAATVSPASKASTITNVAVVDYHTFGDPEDDGRDTDDAIVLLSALPATGGSPMFPLIALGLLVFSAGLASVLIARRRRGEPTPTL